MIRMFRYAMRRLVFVAVVLAPAWGQVESGTIVGTVTDPSGAAVPHVKVTLVNSATGFQRVTVANVNGQYVAYSVPTGEYSVTVAEPGFERLVRHIQLSAAETVTVDLKLVVGNVQQTMEVRATAPLVQDQSATVSELVTNRQVEEMPLNGRMFTQLVLLSPGTVSGSAGALDPGNPYSIRGSANITVNGTSPQMQSFLVDGIFNRSLWVGSLLMVPAIDSIQEVRVQTSNYSAQYGASAGGVTVIQTKSGSNAIHGSAYEFLRNEKMDANQFFNNSLGAPKPAYRRNQFGGTVGGPIRHDKIFYFVDYEGNRVRQPQNVVSTIPTVAQRPMVATGDFTALGTGIFDPYSTGAGGTRNPFVGNLIPASRLDPAAGKLFQLLPAPVNGGATQNYVFNPEQTLTRDQMDARLDDNIGDKNRLFLKYSFDNTDGANPGTLPAPAHSTVPIGPYLADAGNATNAISIPLFTQSGTANYTWVISPTTLNEARAALLRWNLDITPLGNGYNTAAALGIPGININNRAGGLPAFAITGLQSLGDSSSYPEDSHTTTFNFEDVVTLIRGSHTVTLGGLFLRHRFNGFSSFPTRGTYDFNGQFTRQINTTSSKSAIADYALGVPDSVTRMILTSEFGMRLWNLGGYAEDSWRVTGRLTLNYGLRYEIFAPPYDVHNHFSNVDLKTALLEIAGRNGNSRSLRNFDYKDFAPRLGLAYALTGDRKTVLRSGFGVSYNDTIAAGNQLYKNLPYDFNQVVSTDQNGAPPLRLSDGLAAPVAPDINNIQALSTGSPIAWDANMKALRVIQWSAGVQHELARGLLLDLTYVGTRSNRIVAPVDINQPYPGAGAVNPRRPYYAINPNIADIKLYSNSGNGDYEGLQFRIEKRYSQGLTGSLSYSFSKYLSDTQNISGSGNGPPQDARCIRCEWGSMPEDHRQIMVLNHAYELPFGPGRRYLTSGILSYVAGNWNLSGIWTAESGGHFPATLAAAVSNSTGGGTARPNRTGNGNLPSDQRTLNQWFNIAAFVTPAQYTFGNSGQGILEGPGLFNADVGIHRVFRLREKLALTYRWEIFNAFNRANFNNPNASIGNPQAGQISGTGAARVMQMALRLAW